MQVDELFRQITIIFQDHKQLNNGRPDLSVMLSKQNREEYMEIKNRGLGWSEAKAKAAEPPRSNISAYEEPDEVEKSRILSDSLENLLLQIELLLEKLEKSNHIPNIDDLKKTINHTFSQITCMLPIVKTQSGIDPLRFQQIDVSAPDVCPFFV